jgi:NAD(P)-dependent dehydrogenase (short-subunit alcohol dehydrogenase family)
MGEACWKQNPQQLYFYLAKKKPLGRVGEAEKYADLVAFLYSKKNNPQYWNSN